MTPASLATIDGTMLTPGISANRRLYTRENIGRAVARMRQRLANPEGLPIVMRTHHEAGDNSRLIVGRITDVSQLPDGSATYKARLFNTSAGRDIGTLIDPTAPALKATSIHGYWVGPVETRVQGDQTVESSDDLEIDAIDFTANPGVVGARIRSVAFESTAPREEGRAVITENGQATVILDPDAAADTAEVADRPNPIYERYTASQRKAMAAKGQALPSGEWAIASKADLRDALRAAGPGVAERVRAHIKARAGALGFAAMVPAGFGEARPAVPTAETAAEETYVVVCVGDDTGPIVKVSAANVDPSLIKKAAKKAAKIAAHALANGDDTDTDTAGFDLQVGPTGSGMDSAYDYDDENNTREDTVAEKWTVTVNGQDMNADEAKALVAQALAERAPKTPATLAAQAPATPTGTETHPKEVALSDTAVVAEKAPPTTVTMAPDLVALIESAVRKVIGETDRAKAKVEKKALKEARRAQQPAATPPVPAATVALATEAVPAAVAPVVAETTPPAAAATVDESATTTVTAAQLQEMLDKREARTIARVRDQLIAEGNLPGRKGFRHVNETDEGVDNLTGDDLWNKRADIWGPLFPASMQAPVPAGAATAA